MADIKIHFDDREAQEFLRTHGPRKVHNALRSAIRTTTTWAEKEFERRLAGKTEIPLSVFRRFRVKKRVFGGSSSGAFGNGGATESGLVWGGYNPIKSRFVGRMAKADYGATAGAYYFQRAFIAKMRRSSGLQSIFKRRGRARLPIDEQKVSIPQTEAIAESVAGEAERELLRRFRAKFSET
jgi:hypothetical protein